MLVLPTTALPKFTLPGVAVKVAPTTTPVPARVKVCTATDAVSVNEIVPVEPPAVVGAN